MVEAVAQMFLHDNALNTQAFPSLGRIQSDVVRITADLLHGDDDVAGFMTSGGTESILCAVKAARERGREERGITEPEMVVPASAHAAFHKAAHYFGIRLHKVPVRDDWRADVDAMARARRAEHRAGGGQRAAVPAGRDRPDPRAGRRGRRGRRQLPHRRLHGRLLPPVRRGARPRRAAVGLPGGRRHHDQRRPAQARLRAQGRVGGAPPHQGAAPLPDLRVRRLARRLLRQLRACRAPARRCRWPPRGPRSTTSAWRATSGSPSSPSTPAPGWSRASAPSTGSPCSASRRRSASPWPPRPATRTPSTCSRWATRSSPAAGSTIARSRPTRCTPPSAPATRR